MKKDNYNIDKIMDNMNKRMTFQEWIYFILFIGLLLLSGIAEF